MEMSCLTDEVITTIAKAHGKSAAQICLKWAVQRGTAIIPKSTNEERIIQNISLFDFELTEEQMIQINGMNKNIRFCDTTHEPFEAHYKHFLPTFQ